MIKSEEWLQIIVWGELHLSDLHPTVQHHPLLASVRRICMAASRELPTMHQRWNKTGGALLNWSTSFGVQFEAFRPQDFTTAQRKVIIWPDGTKWQKYIQCVVNKVIQAPRLARFCIPLTCYSWLWKLRICYTARIRPQLPFTFKFSCKNKSF